jgi:hypothetical protein
MYTFPWHTVFNVHTDFLVHAPAWIELPFCDLIFEPQRRRLVEQLGPILQYTHSDLWTSYPHDRTCVMWDLRRAIPENIKIIHKNLTLGQPIDFKTLPQMCFIYRLEAHLAHSCSKCPIPVEPLLEDPINRFSRNTRQQQPTPPKTPGSTDKVARSQIRPVKTSIIEQWNSTEDKINQKKDEVQIPWFRK